MPVGVGAMTQRVLVPLDGSPLARTVLPWVHAYAAAVPTDVFLLRVIPPLPLYGGAALGFVEPFPAEDAARLEREAREELRAVGDFGEARSVVELLRFGEPALEIVAAARAVAADMIAMSTHGRTGAARLVLGSVTERVVRQAGRPVVVLRPSPDLLRTQAPVAERVRVDG